MSAYRVVAKSIQLTCRFAMQEWRVHPRGVACSPVAGCVMLGETIEVHAFSEFERVVPGPVP